MLQASPKEVKTKKEGISVFSGNEERFGCRAGLCRALGTRSSGSGQNALPVKNHLPHWARNSHFLILNLVKLRYKERDRKNTLCATIPDKHAQNIDHTQDQASNKACF